MSNNKIDLDRIESVLRDFASEPNGVSVQWLNAAGERETEHLCAASEMLRLVRAVRAAQAYCEWSSGSGDLDDIRPYSAMCAALEPFRKGET